MTDKYTHVTLHSDGGSRNNPGAAGIGIVIHDEKGNLLHAEGQYIGTKTNNEAEYSAMLMGLMKITALYPQCTSVAIFSDSELVVRQVTGIYKIREPGLKLLADQIHIELKHFSKYTITHVLRALNKEADALVNKALDKAGF